MLKEKPVRELVEVEDAGLVSLLGKRVILLCAAYFYDGTLEGVNDTCVELSDAHIVFNAGTWSDPGYETAESFRGGQLFVQVAAIESFGLSNNA